MENIDFELKRIKENKEMSEVKKRRSVIKILSDLPHSIQLIKFHEFYSNEPKQGTEEWKKRRKIGGSNAAAVLCKNPYSRRSDVAKQLLGIDNFPNTITTKWGNFFENAMAKYLEQIGQIQIYEFSSLPGYGKGPATSFSPDGIFIYNNKLNQYINNGIEQEGNAVLLEIKCPYRRAIGRGVPDYYMPQLQLGMHTIKFTKTAMFCEFAVRICSISDFNFTSAIKSTEQNSIIRNRARAIGFVAILGDDMPEFNEPLLNPDLNNLNINFIPTGNLFIDFGNLYRSLNCPRAVMIKIFLHLFPNHRREVFEYFHEYIINFTGIDYGAVMNSYYKWCDTHNDIIINHTQYDLFYSNLIINDNDDFMCKQFMEAELERCNRPIIGIVPYKIFDHDITLVPKQNYSEHVKLMIEFYQQVMEIKKNNSYTEWPALCDNLDILPQDIQNRLNNL